MLTWLLARDRPSAQKRGELVASERGGGMTEVVGVSFGCHSLLLKERD